MIDQFIDAIKKCYLRHGISVTVEMWKPYPLLSFSQAWLVSSTSAEYLDEEIEAIEKKFTYHMENISGRPFFWRAEIKKLIPGGGRRI